MEQSLQALSKQERLEQWSGKIAACRGSGMTVRAWCQERGISEKTYYYWQWRLFQELIRTQAQGSGFVDITPANVGGSGQIAAKVHILRLKYTTERTQRHWKRCSGDCGHAE